VAVASAAASGAERSLRGLAGSTAAALLAPGAIARASLVLDGAYRPYYRGYGWRYPYGGYYRRYPYYGGAVLAGLTLGALSYPYGYGYGYPHYGTASYGGDCYWVRRRVIGRYGGVVIRNVQVCEY
jgi:hypothetical protein